MKQTVCAREIYSDEIQRLYVAENGLHVRDVTLDMGIGQEITIGHICDLHFNACNEQDFSEANPAVLSTWEHRKWMANGASAPIARRCLEFLSDMDQIVVNGDTLDYLSHGCMEIMQREIWDRWPGILASVGGHETVRKMQGKAPDETTRESRLKILQDFWQHDIFYESKLVREKILVVAMLNDPAMFTEEQEDRFRADLARARKNGWSVLVFVHEPVRTCNPAHANVTAADVILPGDAASLPANFCAGTRPCGLQIAGCDEGDEATRSLWRLLTGSADVVKGVFAGHWHSHMQLDIMGCTPDGTPAVIPQFVLTASVYDEGHVMRILIR